MKLSRRAFLAAIPLAPTAAEAYGLGSGSISFDNVVRQIGGVGDVSSYLLAAVNKEFVATYGAPAQGAFTRTLSGGALGARIATASDEIKGQVAFVAKLLYTGEVTKDGVTTAAYYPWCLAWASLTFATAPGLCGGPAFGHWQNAPLPGQM